jgi:hypothetical protein
MALANITNNILTDSGILVSSLQGALTLTTTGSSGASTLIGNTLNIPNYGGGLTSYVPYTGATGSVNLGTNDLTSRYLVANGAAGLGGVLNIKQDAAYSPLGNGFSSIASSFSAFDFYGYTGASTYKNFQLRFDGLTNNTVRTYTLPDASGTFALTSDIPSLTGYVQGSGTTNYLPKFTGTSTIGNSVIQEASGSIGINVSPVADLQVGKSSGVTIAMSNSSSVTSGTRGGLTWYNSNVSTVADIRAVAVTDNVGTQLEFYTRPVGGSLTQAMTLNASGNLGLGVTPSASNWATFELLGGNTITSYPSATIPALYSASNAYYNSGWIYKNSTNALMYAINANSGQFQWFIAPSGTAGNAISFTQAMTLNASGNLSIGNTNDTYKLDVSGTGRFTSNLTTDGIFIGRTSNGQAFGVGNGVDSDMGIFVQTNNIAFSNSGTSSGISFALGGTTRFSIASTGAATFSSSVTANYYDGEIFRVITSSTLRGGLGTGSWAFGDGTTDIALYSGAAMKIGAGGSQKMIITSTGNVGIGTTSPAYKLDVQNGSDFDIRLRDTSLGGTVGILFETGNDFSGTSQAWIKGIGAGNSGVSQLIFGTAGASGDTTATERMRITSGGNVEINTGSIKTGAPSGGTAQPWKLGTVYTGTCVPNSFGDFTSWFQGTVIEIEVNGTTYKIPAVIDNYC